MKVIELKKLLVGLGKEWNEREVVLSIDSEGNGHSKITDYSIGLWDDGEIKDPEWSADDACYDDEEEWEEYKRTQERVLVLWP